jgi:hypothetical protein
VLCPAGCGASFVRSKWEHHYETECSKIYIECKQCGVLMDRNDPNHNCFESLKARNSDLEAQLKEALNQIKVLGEQMTKQHNMF